MPKLLNNVKMSVASTGAGAITLGAARQGFQTFADAGAIDGDEIVYGILDGASWEHGVLTYVSSTTSFTRNVSASSNSGSPISVTSKAVVFSTARAEDLATAEQGGKAETAIQPADLAPVATSGDYADLSNKPEILSPIAFSIIFGS